MSENILRIAAISDTHFRAPKPRRLAGYDFNPSKFEQHVKAMSRQADVIVHCGDFTDRGDEESLKIIADVLSKATVPIVGVLGNHDVTHGPEMPARILSEEGGITILDGNKVTLPHGSREVGFIGVPGFISNEQGNKDPNIKVSIEEYEAMVVQNRERFYTTMEHLEGTNNIVLFHFDQYHPHTPSNEPPSEDIELTEFAELVDQHADQVSLSLYGHNHRGNRRPTISPRQVRAYDVAMPIQIRMHPNTPIDLRVPYRNIEVSLRPEASTSSALPSPVGELHYPRIPDLHQSAAPVRYASH